MVLCWLGLYPHLTLPRAMVNGWVVAWKLPSSYQESALKLSLDVFVAARKRLILALVGVYLLMELVSQISHVGRHMTKVHRRANLRLSPPSLHVSVPPVLTSLMLRCQSL